MGAIVPRTQGPLKIVKPCLFSIFQPINLLPYTIFRSCEKVCWRSRWACNSRALCCWRKRASTCFWRGRPRRCGTLWRNCSRTPALPTWQPRKAGRPRSPSRSCWSRSSARSSAWTIRPSGRHKAGRRPFHPRRSSAGWMPAWTMPGGRWCCSTPATASRWTRARLKAPLTGG